MNPETHPEYFTPKEIAYYYANIMTPAKMWALLRDPTILTETIDAIEFTYKIRPVENKRETAAIAKFDAVERKSRQAKGVA